MRDQDIAAIGRRLLRPYGIPRECPYLSEDQRELSRLDFKGRSEWMAEWLALAASAKGSLLRKTTHRRSSRETFGAKPSEGKCAEDLPARVRAQAGSARYNP